MRTQPDGERPRILLQPLSPGPLRAADLVRETHKLEVARLTGYVAADVGEREFWNSEIRLLLGEKW